jgi:uncharacterized membrane protein YhhN
MVGLCVLAVVVLLAAEWWERPAWRRVAKTTASTAFVAVGWMHAPPIVFLGLVAGWFGDVLLLGTDRRWFVAGIAAFLLNHVAYTMAFLGHGVDAHRMGLALAPVVLVALPVLGVLWSRVGRLRVPVAAYVVVIGGMVVAAAGTGRPMWMAAGVAFFVSDLAVARQRFLTAGFANKAVGLPLYYGAQLLFALDP